MHHPFQKINIVVIPYHPAKSLQATTLSFIFILVTYILKLDSNWNTMQQVRILVTLCLEQRNRTYKLEFFRACLCPILTYRTCNFAIQSPLQPCTTCLSHGVQFLQYCFKEIKKWANQDIVVPIIIQIKPRLFFQMNQTKVFQKNY